MAESAYRHDQLREALLGILEAADLKASFRQPGNADWERAAARVVYLPVDYSIAMMD